MNDAHLHLAVNHLPIVGLLLGMLILIVGMIWKKNQVKMTSLGIFIFCMVTVLAVHETGENAEEILETISGISHTLIHEHEEATELFFILTITIGILSTLMFVLEYLKSKYRNIGYFIVLVVAAIGIYASIEAANSGGAIRHPEIHSEFVIENDHDD